MRVVSGQLTIRSTRRRSLNPGLVGKMRIKGVGRWFAIGNRMAARVRSCATCLHGQPSQHGGRSYSGLAISNLYPISHSARGPEAAQLDHTTTARPSLSIRKKVGERQGDGASVLRLKFVTKW